ncbi:MAG: hypothetical protein ISS23_01870 [Nanoarchaeota archaeon]|nr:hypothetical protein [Nanoarchaeota archaeon]
MKKKLVLFGAISLLTFNIACSATTNRNSRSEKPGLTGIIETNPIKVVKGPGTVYDISINQIQRIYHQFAKTTQKEDVHLYVDGKLYDIGFAEKTGSVIIDSDYTIKLLKEKHPNSKNVIFIHPHPLNNVDSEEIRPPNNQDIWTYATLKTKIRKETGINLEAVIYDGRGVWTYEITEKFESEVNKSILYQKKQLEEGKAPIFTTGTGNLYHDIFFTLLNKLEKKILEDNSLSREEQIKKYIEEIKKLDIIFTYTPLEK